MEKMEFYSKNNNKNSLEKILIFSINLIKKKSKLKYTINVKKFVKKFGFFSHYKKLRNILDDL